MSSARNLLLAIALVVVALPGSADDGEAVRTAFSAYRAAVLAGDGAAAAGLLSTSTHQYYGEMQQLALHGDAPTVQALSLVDQMQVLLFRLRVPAEQLDELSPKGLVAHSVDEGWIGKDSVLTLAPGKVQSEGDVAVLHVFVNGQDAGPAFRFNREPTGWKLDLLPTLQASNATLQLAAKERGVSEDEFMLILMESILGRKVTPDAWTPPRPGERPAPQAAEDS